MTAQTWFWAVTTFLLGICIGSFLNVVIYRLPRNLSVNEPKWSFCPNCPDRRQLSAMELIPLISYLALKRRCRCCRQPISSRYFWVELLTGVLFVVLYLRFHADAPNAITLLLFTAVMVPVFFIDFATFTIPNSLNLLAFVIAVGRDLYGIFTHEPGHELMWGWLPRSLLGAVAGILIFGTVRVLGWVWKRQEAMGLGDVFLARAMGALLISFVPVGDEPLRLFPIWVMLSCGSGAVVGLSLLGWRRLQEAQAAPHKGSTASDEDEAPPETDSNLKEQLLAIGQVLWLQDAWWYYLEKTKPEPVVSEEEDTWTPAPTAIPFGPYLILGFLATVLVGEPLTAMYLAFALPKTQRS